ncbi:MAG: HAD-IG family 5'-nucleotidase [Actinobacteria bacterium]|nr:HAD-IG family 5'-nucleotidase [Actinomycetota bacterium]
MESSPPPAVPPERRIYANRTLNLRSIRAIGYDMDYTLIHYRVEEWERGAYEAARAALAARGWPVDGLAFDPATVIRGLTLDLELGNLVKPTRFGYVIKASHGTEPLDYDRLRRAYHGTVVNLAEDRFVFLNTLFSLSEAHLFAQLVDLLDEGLLPKGMSYTDVYRAVRETIDEAHMEGALKDKITADPERYVVHDPDMAAALVDQHGAGKRLLLITNSGWDYTKRMMAYALDPHLPAGTTWRDLFEVVIVSSSKPGFFEGSAPWFEVVDEERGLLRPHPGAIAPGAVYFGGNAADLEESLGLSGDQILYVGDHLFADVHVSKTLLRWRTALIIRELESEILDQSEFVPTEHDLQAQMTRKEDLQRRLSLLRLERQHAMAAGEGHRALTRAVEDLRAEIVALDEEIAPLARAAGRLRNEAWGPLMRSGNDKSLFARQVERYADVYTSRASNFRFETPYAFLRAARGSLPHDPA